MGSRWRRHRRNRARPRHRGCQGGCRVLGGVSRGVGGAGGASAWPLSLHASLCLVVNMRDVNIIIYVLFMCTARQWPTGSALLIFLKPRDSLPNGGGVDTDLGGSRPPSRWSIRELHAVTPIRNRRAPPPARICSILFPAASHMIRID